MEYKFPIIHNPVDGIIYVDDLGRSIDEISFDNMTPLMNAKRWASNTQHLNLTGNNGMAMTQQVEQDPYSLEDIFYDNDKPEYNFKEISHNWINQMRDAQLQKDPREGKSMAMAVITSTDFIDFQNTVIVGQNLETNVRTGVLASQFQEISLPNLSGKWASFDSDVKYFTNIPEGKSPEPTGGKGTVVSVTVPKHGGAIAITERAQDVINGDNPFSRLTGILQRRRLESENKMYGTEIESNTTPTIAGIDFGVRTGSPPASTTNPADFLTSVTNVSEGLSQPFDLFISKGFMYWEYIYNDIVRGANNPLPTQGGVNEQVGGFPGLPGVTWARDNAITSTVNGWIMNSNAIKGFRGPSRAYTVVNQDAETTKYVTKSHLLVETVAAPLIYMVTNIAAP